MEIGILNLVLFILAFIILFFAKGYFIARKSTKDFEELFARSFVISSAVLLVGSFVISKTVGLNPISLGVFILATIIVSLYRSANP